jgi:hypothetical protein
VGSGAPSLREDKRLSGPTLLSFTTPPSWRGSTSINIDDGMRLNTMIMEAYTCRMRLTGPQSTVEALRKEVGRTDDLPIGCLMLRAMTMCHSESSVCYRLSERNFSFRKRMRYTQDGKYFRTSLEHST